jgi:hypothetical protein
MTYRGRIRNGVVVFEGGRHPKEGTAVEVRPVPAGAGKQKTGIGKRPNGTKLAAGRARVAPRGSAKRRQQRPTLDDIASEQGLTRIVPFDQLLGGWPAGEAADGFEETIAGWRVEEPRAGEF